MKPTRLIKALVVAATTAGLAAVPVVGPVAGPVQAAADGAPDKPTMFVDNDPNGSGQERYRIRNYLVNLINGATKGSTITIASYRFNDQKIADALIAAMTGDRKVTVQVITDYAHSKKKPYLDVAKAVREPSWIKNCGQLDEDGKGGKAGTSCIGTHIMHNKFFLFEETHGKSDVVVQTTANLSGHSGPEMWNTAYTAIGEKWLYDQYKVYFADLDDAVKRSDYYRYYNETHAPTEKGKFKLYHSPRREADGNNTFANILSNVRCDGNTTGGTTDGNRTIIRVTAYMIRGAGGTEVADRLWKLDNQGCYVDIIGTDVGQGKDGPLRGGLLRAPTGKYHGPEVREFSKNQCGTHEKNFLIDGFYDGKPNQKVVFTGSHNLNDKSLWSNDETILRITDADVHEKFKQHFFKVRDAAAITWQTSKYATPDKFHFKCPG